MPLRSRALRARADSPMASMGESGLSAASTASGMRTCATSTAGVWATKHALQATRIASALKRAAASRSRDSSKGVDHAVAHARVEALGVDGERVAPYGPVAVAPSRAQTP